MSAHDALQATRSNDTAGAYATPGPPSYSGRVRPPSEGLILRAAAGPRPRIGYALLRTPEWAYLIAELRPRDVRAFSVSPDEAQALLALTEEDLTGALCSAYHSRRLAAKAQRPGEGHAATP